jgi:small subunit ribosomal protein S19e
MVTVRDVPADKLINRLKEELKKFKEISPPHWAKFVKSGVHRERPPEQEDFWFIRAASILRRIYLNGPVGVSRLRSYYGGARKRGSRPRHFRKASGAIIRKILQQLEKVNLIEKNKRGRKVTAKGKKFLDKIAYEVRK